MEKTNWSIISNYWEWTREDFLFTYSEEEKQEIRFNKMVVEQEIKWYSYFLIYEQQLILWFSEPEAIMFNFIDWYTKAWKLFWYSIPQICKKTHRWRDKVINTIKVLIDKWYVVEHPWKDRYWRNRRFLSTTTKYNSELSKLIYQSENPTIPVGKSDGYQSENPTHSNIYSSINNIYICPENVKNDDISRYNVGFDPDNSKERKEKVAPKEKKEILWYSEEFEKFWKLYPAPSWRWSKKDSWKKWNSWNDEDIDKIKLKILEECVYVKSWKKEKQWVCAFEKFLENNKWVDVDIEWLVNTYMKYNWDIKKKWLELMKKYFWEDLIKKYIFKYIKENENFNLDLH